MLFELSMEHPGLKITCTKTFSYFKNQDKLSEYNFAKCFICALQVALEIYNSN